MSPRHRTLARLMLLVTACAGSPPRPTADATAARTLPPAEIRGVTWELTELHGAPVSPGARPAPTLRLAVDTLRMTGSGGCNRIAGGYMMRGAELRFGPLLTTRMFCPGAMDVETAFSAALAAVQRWRLAGPELELTAADTVLAKLRRQ